MSKQRAKGTRFETLLLGPLRRFWPRAQRTGSNHHTAWGAADFAMTGEFAIEAKNWKNEVEAVRVGWGQCVDNARMQGKKPMLVVSLHGKPVGKSLVVLRLEDLDAVPRPGEQSR